MRMNRGTIGLIAILLVVIVAVLVINNNQASAPGVTPTVASATGPLLAGVTANTIEHYEVRDNASGNFTALTKDSGGAWHLDGTNLLPGRDPDQSLIGSTAGQIVSINYNNTFQDDQLANFGLASPAYTVLVSTSDGKQFTLYIGAKTVTSSGYYAVLQTGTGPVATEAAAASTAEATAETTAAAKKLFRELQAATAEATSQATTESGEVPQAIATENVTSAQENGSSVVPNNATVEPTAEVTAEATANVIPNPAVTLTGKQTIYVIPQTVIDTLTRWVTTPPYAPLPTPVPTDSVAPPLELPTLEATAPATGEATIPATAEATVAATVAATAAS